MATIPSMLGRLVTWWRAREDRRWLDAPSGCCTCGTGGPYYRGSAPQVTRYLYTGACGPADGLQDWSSCSLHPLDMEPLVDYGQDVVRTGREADADAAEAWSARTRTEG